MGGCCGVLANPQEKYNENDSSANGEKVSHIISVDITQGRESNPQHPGHAKSTSITGPDNTSMETTTATGALSDPVSMKSNSLVSRMKVKRNFSMDEMETQPRDPQDDLDRAVFANQLSFAHNLTKKNIRYPSESPPLSTIASETTSDSGRTPHLDSPSTDSANISTVSPVINADTTTVMLPRSAVV